MKNLPIAALHSLLNVRRLVKPRSPRKERIRSPEQVKNYLRKCMKFQVSHDHGIKSNPCLQGREVLSGPSQGVQYINISQHDFMARRNHSGGAKPLRDSKGRFLPKGS